MTEPYEERQFLPDVPRTQIGQLRPGVRNLHCTFIILDKSKFLTSIRLFTFLAPPKQINNGSKVSTCKVADESGTINLTLWNEAAEYLCPGDVCSLKGGSTSIHRGCMSLATGKNSEILKTGRIITVHPVSLFPNMSEYCREYETMFTSTKGNPSSDNQEEGTYFWLIFNSLFI
jgi:hypothetical protein